MHGPLEVSRIVCILQCVLSSTSKVHLHTVGAKESAATGSHTREISVQASGSTILQVIDLGFNSWGQKDSEANQMKVFDFAQSDGRPAAMFLAMTETPGNNLHSWRYVSRLLGNRALPTSVVLVMILLAFTMTCCCYRFASGSEESLKQNHCSEQRITRRFRAAPAWCIPYSGTRKALPMCPGLAEIKAKEACADATDGKSDLAHDAYARHLDDITKMLGADYIEAKIPASTVKSDMFESYTDCDSEIQSTCLESTDIEHSCISEHSSADSGDELDLILESMMKKPCDCLPQTDVKELSIQAEHAKAELERIRKVPVPTDDLEDDTL